MLPPALGLSDRHEATVPSGRAAHGGAIANSLLMPSPMTVRRIMPRTRSSAGSPSTPPPGSGHEATRYRCRSSRSKRRRRGTTPPAPVIRIVTCTCTCRSTRGCSQPASGAACTVGVRDSLNAANGIGHVAMLTDPAFRAALAQHGFSLNASGEIVQLAGYVGAFSQRAAGMRVRGPMGVPTRSRPNQARTCTAAGLQDSPHWATGIATSRSGSHPRR